MLFRVNPKLTLSAIDTRDTLRGGPVDSVYVNYSVAPVLRMYVTVRTLRCNAVMAIHFSEELLDQKPINITLAMESAIDKLLPQLKKSLGNLDVALTNEWRDAIRTQARAIRREALSQWREVCQPKLSEAEVKLIEDAAGKAPILF